MSHLDEGTLHALLDGEIPSRELGPIQSHLAACPDCRNRLEEERGLATQALDLVQEIEVPSGPARLNPRHPARRTATLGLAWAATLIGAVGLGYAARGISDSGPTAAIDAAPEARAFPPADAASAAAADSVPPASPAGPAANLAAAPRADESPRRDRESARTDAPSPSPAPAPRAGNAPAAQPAPVPSRPLEEAVVADQTARDRAPARLEGLEQQSAKVAAARAVAQPPASAGQATIGAAVEPVSFPDALQRLNGSIRLIPGLIPIRLEASGPLVRVVYQVAEGELVLNQEVVGGRLTHLLLAPPGFPADSLAALRARVRE